MREPRIAVMILGEATWEDATGIRQRVPVWMEDKSAGGACLRVKTRVSVGAKVKVHCRHEQFTGTSRYCRYDGKEFLVGIQRDTTSRALVPQQARNATPPQEIAKADEAGSQQVPEPATKAAQPSSAKAESVTGPALVARETDTKITVGKQECEKVSEAPTAPSPAGPPAKAMSRAEMRKPMKRKLLELTRWHTNKETSNANVSAEDTTANASKQEKSLDPVQAVVPRLNVELLSTEDIYRSAGILNVRGYGVHKVVEMLRNEHIRGLSNDMKRAAVLMALDAAGIAVDQVLRDAKARQEALDSYESDQRKQVETEWSRKAEENRQIEAELERIKEQYMSRVARNQESMEREKATFNTWLTVKRQEFQSSAEAAELCRGGGEAKAMQAAASQS